MVKSALVLVILLISLKKVHNQETTPSGVFVENACICVTSGSCGIAGGKSFKEKFLNLSEI